MATVIDRPTAQRSIGVVRWVAAALLIGAGALRLALAPSHFGESTSEGIGFVVAAWLQIGLAVALLVRPSRAVAGGTIVVSAACIGAWLFSRTVGLPFGAHAGHQAVTVVDGVTVAMEAATIVLVAMLLLEPSVRRFRSNPAAIVGIVAVLALASAVIAAPETRNHADVAHGGHTHTASEAAASGAGQTHDHAASATSGAAAVAVDANGHEVLGPKAHDVAAENRPDEWLDAATRARLRDQLIAAREAAMLYPTVADAIAAGYRRLAVFGPGTGAHYVTFDSGFEPFDAAKAPTLIYDGTSPTSQIVGLMYLGGGNAAPEGFAGPNDHWHRHSNVCSTSGPKGIEIPLSPDSDVTEAQCTAVQGDFQQTTGWMLHAWVVPGWESPAGVFSHKNPNLRCADGTNHTDKDGKCQGS